MAAHVNAAPVPMCAVVGSMLRAEGAVTAPATHVRVWQQVGGLGVAVNMCRPHMRLPSVVRSQTDVGTNPL
jgi:hypothetical protein